MPAMNIWPIEVPDNTPNTIMVMLGGISGSMTALMATSAAPYAAGMPCRAIAGIIRLPMAEDCAMALPEIPANMMLASTVTSDKPPLK
jgi:hypothetical protein